ncbi:uncharacterized protein V6R79_006879 [Siganus canaliculatus]
MTIRHERPTVTGGGSECKKEEELSVVTSLHTLALKHLHAMFAAAERTDVCEQETSSRYKKTARITPEETGVDTKRQRCLKTCRLIGLEDIVLRAFILTRCSTYLSDDSPLLQTSVMPASSPVTRQHAVKIKKNKDNVKFKVRCSRYLYTLVITDKEKAEKLKQSLPPGLAVKELKLDCDKLLSDFRLIARYRIHVLVARSRWWLRSVRSEQLSVGRIGAVGPHRRGDMGAL